MFVSSLLRLHLFLVSGSFGLVYGSCSEWYVVKTISWCIAPLFELNV